MYQNSNEFYNIYSNIVTESEKVVAKCDPPWLQMPLNVDVELYEQFSKKIRRKSASRYHQQRLKTMLTV